VRELWRKKGPIGKFHNTISFIRKTPQRRKAFLGIYDSGITLDIQGTLLEIFFFLYQEHGRGKISFFKTNRIGLDLIVIAENET
jgi:hypothetical protein